ncbi:MAG: glycosyltransferase [Candidatus Omnitrophica bacterium]|nr:glycosyltransferase [Candidatus Omnitrophota bacterium]
MTPQGLSVVIAAYNREGTIGRCLEAIKASSYKDYEMIVVDDGSVDRTADIAEKLADKVIRLPGHRGPAYARTKGIEASNGAIIISVDSDILIKPDTLLKIHSFFLAHPEFDALTGLFSKEHPNKNFFSQYKNLYMNYMFSKLPGEVTFLFGSICALRRQAFPSYDMDIGTDDTALGQKLYSSGKRIAFLKDLEVVHLRRHDFISFLKNDFFVPFMWVKVFLRYGGVRQLGRKGTGFAHSPKEQLASVAITPVIFIMGFVWLFTGALTLPLAVLAATWCLLNYSFLSFLARERGGLFAFLAIFATFMDNMVMASAILCGFISDLVQEKDRR